MEEKEEIIDEHILSTTDLAFERTILAENRTLMAWIRTSISLTSFGFTIYKFFQDGMGSPNAGRRLLTPREVGMAMILLGLLSLLWGLLEYNAIFKKLKKSYPSLHRTRAAWLARLILLFGILLFLAALFRQ